MKRKIIGIVVTLATIITLSVVLMAVKADTNASNLLTVTNTNAFDNAAGESFVQANAEITDFEIVIKKENVLKNMTVEVLYPDVKISETDEDYRIYYYQACASSEKKEIKAGTKLLTIKYNVPENYFNTHKQYNETLKMDVATYTLPLKGSVNLKSDGKIYSDFNISNSTLNIYGNRYGDVNKDGKITGDDVYVLYNHLNDKTPITDEVSLRYADANGDGIVDPKDKAAIYAYVLEHPNGELSNVPLETKSYVAYGDANDDGKINNSDAIIISYYLVGNTNLLTEQGKQNADINNDGKITPQDSIYILKYTLNPTRYPVPANFNAYLYGDIDFDNTVGFSDITKLIDMKYNNKSSYVWNEEVINAMGLDSGSKPGFSEIIALINYTYEPHNIIYNLDGGKITSTKYDKTFRSADFAFNLPTVVKSGTIFDYWAANVDEVYETVGKAYKVVSKDITYTAIWK